MVMCIVLIPQYKQYVSNYLSRERERERETEGSILTSRIDLSFLHWRKREGGNSKMCIFMCKRQCFSQNTRPQARRVDPFQGLCGLACSGITLRGKPSQKSGHPQIILRKYRAHSALSLHVIKCIFEKFVSGTSSYSHVYIK